MFCENVAVTTCTLPLLLARESSFSGIVNYVFMSISKIEFPYEGNSLQTSVPFWLGFSSRKLQMFC